MSSLLISSRLPIIRTANIAMTALWLLTGCVLVNAQSSVASVPVSGSNAPADNSSYTVLPGDTLSITVSNFPELCNSAATVLPDGCISTMLLNTVSVSGKTTAQIAKMLTIGWNHYVNNPFVTVNVAQKHIDYVYVDGYVAHPGSIPYSYGMHLLQAIAEAGGVLQGSEMDAVTLTSATNLNQTIDISHPESRGGTPADLPLHSGDSIYVPQAKQVSLVGEVNKPGGYTYTQDMTVLDAIMDAGGVTTLADPKGAILTHNGTVQPIDLYALLHLGATENNIKLSPGDQISIPQMQRTYVFGQVGRPGYYGFQTGDRILDALHSAGGPLPDANMTNINYIHVNPDKTTTQLTQIDLDKFFKQGDLASNRQLLPGDVIYIPKRHQGVSWDSLWSVLGGLNVFDAGASIIKHGAGASTSIP